jgi:hypothetical protein
MKAIPRLALLIPVALLLVVGCGHKSSALTAKDEAAFAQASPEVKQMWTKGCEAANANDYTTAYNLFYQLVNTGLTPEQKTAVTKVNAALNERLMAALEKGDPNAQKAFQEMKAQPPARQSR